MISKDTIQRLYKIGFLNSGISNNQRIFEILFNCKILIQYREHAEIIDLKDVLTKIELKDREGLCMPKGAIIKLLPPENDH